MSTERGSKDNLKRQAPNRSKMSQQDADLANLEHLELNATQPHHVQSQTLIDQQHPLDFAGGVGSDGEEIKSPTRGVNTNNSNESVPIRSAQDNSQQSYSYDFLYDPEVANKRGSSVSNKLSSNNSVAAQSAMSPHVFMLSNEEQRQHATNKSATTSVPGGFDYVGGQRGSSIVSRSSMGPFSHQTSNNEDQKEANDATNTTAIVTKYDQQRAVSQQISGNVNLTEGQEEQFIEEEYYIEEEIEEECEEEEQSMQTYEQNHNGVETIKEVSSDQENQSPGNSSQQLGEPMGTIMQTASLSAGKKHHHDSAHFTQSQKAMNASDFKDLQGGFGSSSKNTDSNMASLVFRPRDSDAALQSQFMQASMSINSNASGKHRNSSKKGGRDSRSGGESNLLQMHNSHPSFGVMNQHQQSNASGAKKAFLPDRWIHMAEKCATRMLTKDIFVQLSKINEIFQRKTVQQEIILSSQSQMMQLKSFLDISLNSSFNNVHLSQAEQDIAYDNLQDKPLFQIQQEMSMTVQSIASRLMEYFRGESDILQAMAQERERNVFLENEISARETRIRPVSSNMMNNMVGSGDDEGVGEDDYGRMAVQQIEEKTEDFINELEDQLQQARADLLSAKLTISDQNVEIENLKIKNKQSTSQVSQFMADRRNFEESFENMRQQLGALQSQKLELSQMIRDRESSLTPSQHLGNQFNGNQSSSIGDLSNQHQNFQTQPHNAHQQQHLINSGLTKQPSLHSTSFNSRELKGQIENLNRQVFEAQKKQESLQMVENNLIEKLDRQELENLELRDGFFELKQENQMKGEVIAKAQKIIERLTNKSDSDERVLHRLNEENEGFKRDLGERQKVVTMLNDQLKEVSAKQTHDHTLMQDTMSKELEEVRHAVREYQLELDSEKSNCIHQIQAVQDQLQQAQLERDSLKVQSESREAQLSLQTENQDKLVTQLNERVKSSEAVSEELRQELKKQVSLVEESAKNQIKYLQSRIKEIVEETESTGSPNHSTKDLLASNKSLTPSGKNISLLVSVKKELESMCSEVLAIRETLRSEGKREDTLVNQKMSKFDEFKLSVLDQLILWDEKTAELCCLAERYSGALEEQKKLFFKLKLVVQEKDQIITELNRQIVMRNSSQNQHFDAMKVELENTNRVMAEEMLNTISLLEQKVCLKEKEVLETEERALSFRKEFTAVLEERNFFERELEQTKDKLRFQESELAHLQTTQSDQYQTYGDLLNIRSIQVTPQTIEHAVRNLVTDCKRYSTEMVSYRDKLQESEKDRAEERLLLNSKVTSLEDQYQNLQKQSIDKEEEQQLEFVDRENQLIRDAEKAQAYADKIEAELQTRERQLKKIQDKIDEDEKRVQDAQAKTQIVAQEKADAVTQRLEIQATNDLLNGEVQQMAQRIRQQEDLYNMTRQDMQKEQKVLSDKLQTIRDLESIIHQREETIDGQINQHQEMEAKIRVIENRSTQTSQDLQELYQELTEVKHQKFDIESAKQSLSLENQSLLSTLKKKQIEVEQKDSEIEQYQKTVMRQTRELEKSQKNVDLVNQQKDRLQNFDDTMQKQASQIDALRQELQGPDRFNQGTQTVDSGLLELQYARNEVIKSQQCQEVVYQENMQLKESVQRSSYEVCRLIEDKRELEDLIEKLNKNLGMFRSQQANGNNLMGTGKISFEQTLTANGGSNDMVGQVLAEKENYIGNLENEITEMRKEIEIQRDQLLQAEAQTIDAKANQSYMSLGATQSVFNSQPYPCVPSSPHYLQSAGFNSNMQQPSYNTRQRGSNNNAPSHHAPLRSTSREKQAYGNGENHHGDVAPNKLNAVTMNYSTLSRSLTPIDNITSSGSNAKSGYFHQGQNSSVAFTNNQTQASNTPMLNQTHYNSHSHGGILMRPQDNASYLNPNHSSVMMNYQTTGMNQSVTTHDKSWVDPRQGGGQQPTNQQNFYQSSSAQMGVNQQHSPSAREDNTYGQDYIHA